MSKENSRDIKTFLDEPYRKDYTPIWEAIKKHGRCKVAIIPAKREEIIRGVINKKDRDPAFKLELAEQNRRTFLRIKRETKFVTFTLIYWDSTRLRKDVL